MSEVYAIDYRGYRIVVQASGAARVHKLPQGTHVATAPTEEQARRLVDLFCEPELRNDPVDRI